MKTKKDIVEVGMHVVCMPEGYPIDWGNLNRGVVQSIGSNGLISVEVSGGLLFITRPEETHVVYIVAAAMLMNDGDALVGIRHFSPEMRKTAEKAYGPEYYKKVKEQGFVDQWGEFFNREDAWKIAEANGQIRFEVSTPGTLYSECLY